MPTFDLAKAREAIEDWTLNDGELRAYLEEACDYIEDLTAKPPTFTTTEEAFLNLLPAHEAAWARKVGALPPLVQAMLALWDEREAEIKAELERLLDRFQVDTTSGREVVLEELWTKGCNYWF